MKQIIVTIGLLASLCARAETLECSFGDSGMQPIEVKKEKLDPSAGAGMEVTHAHSQTVYGVTAFARPKGAFLLTIVGTNADGSEITSTIKAVRGQLLNVLNKRPDGQEDAVSCRAVK